MNEGAENLIADQLIGAMLRTMRLLSIMLCAVAVLFVSCNRAAKACAVCQREECKGLAFRVTLENGKRVETCCPRCGLHYAHSAKPSASSMQATDFFGGKWIDAKNAIYVSGSDVNHCAATETKRDAYGCCMVKAFDRCMPSLIAFTSPEAAGAFQKQHGGQIVGFEKIAAN